MSPRPSSCLLGAAVLLAGVVLAVGCASSSRAVHTSSGGALHEETSSRAPREPPDRAAPPDPATSASTAAPSTVSPEDEATCWHDPAKRCRILRWNQIGSEMLPRLTALNEAFKKGRTAALTGGNDPRSGAGAIVVRSHLERLPAVEAPCGPKPCPALIESVPGGGIKPHPGPGQPGLGGGIKPHPGPGQPGPDDGAESPLPKVAGPARGSHIKLFPGRDDLFKFGTPRSDGVSLNFDLVDALKHRAAALSLGEDAPASALGSMSELAQVASNVLKAKQYGEVKTLLNHGLYKAWIQGKRLAPTAPNAKVPSTIGVQVHMTALHDVLQVELNWYVEPGNDVEISALEGEMASLFKEVYTNAMLYVARL